MWRSKTSSTEKFTFEVYYDLLWNAAYQHDLNNAAGQKKRQAFISQQVDSFNESDLDPGEDTPTDQDENDSSAYSIFQSSFNSPEPQKPTKILSPMNFGESFLRLQRSLSLSITRRLKFLTLNHLVATPKPKRTLDKPNPKPQQVDFHENDCPPENPHSEDSTQAMVHECLTDGGIDPSDIDTVMSAFKSKSGKLLKILQGKSKLTKDLSLLEPITPPITWLIWEPMEA